MHVLEWDGNEWTRIHVALVKKSGADECIGVAEKTVENEGETSVEGLDFDKLTDWLKQIFFFNTINSN